MSVVGYFSKPCWQELRMPKEHVDALGIRYVGEVLTGGMSVKGRMDQVAASATSPTRPEGGIWTSGVRQLGREGSYQTVAEYDAMLKHHCRLADMDLTSRPFRR